jgi:2-oxoisovalerate dehydrogenase E1 component alpha subunit
LLHLQRHKIDDEEALMALSEADLREMYWTMLLARRLDERAWILHRQGKIAFHISGIGQEAAQVGAAFALERGKDWFVPYYRDLALMIALGYKPLDFIMGLMGKKGEPTSGAKQMPSHWSLKEANVVSHSSPVATQTTHAAGIGLGIKMSGSDEVVLTSIGEGSTSQGEWYEGVNWAAVHKLPVIFLVENNIYAISVRQELQMATQNVAQKADGLGLPGYSIDGLDVRVVHETISQAAERARAGEGPTLVEVLVSRMTPHSSDDDDRTYRTREEVEQMKANDPLSKFEEQLKSQAVLTEETIEEMEAKAKEEIQEAVSSAEALDYPDISEARHPVYAEEVSHD